MSDQLIYELNGQRYLLVEVLMTSENSEKMERVSKKYECIHQGIKEIKRGLFSGYAIMQWLVPEKNIILFNNEP